MDDAYGCLWDGTSWMLNVLMDVSEKSAASFQFKKMNKVVDMVQMVGWPKDVSLDVDLDVV